MRRRVPVLAGCDTCPSGVLALYGTDKKQLKVLREKFPALVPCLVR